MKTISEYKDRSIESLDGKWGNAAIATIIYIAIISAVGGCVNAAIVNGAGSIAMLLLLPMSYGFNLLWLSVARGGDVDYGKMFEGFKDYVRIFLTMMLVGIYTFLWSLLLIVPGIIKSYSYKLTPYILADSPGMKYDEAIETSMFMMKGRKMKLFLLDLSFIGWWILSILTLGIGFIFLIPYVEAAHADFYNDICEEFSEE